MASVVDCFHDDSDEDEHDAISDVQWSKLKSAHMKEGFRDGYSAGQEAVLQQAFNTGFAHQVKIDTHAAFYKGILMALKIYSEKLRNTEDPKVGLSAEDASRIESLLGLLETVTKNTSSSQLIPTEIIKAKELSKLDFKEDVTEQDMNLESSEEHTKEKLKQMVSNVKVENISTAIGGTIGHDGCCTDSNPSGVNERTVCSKGDFDKTKADTCHKGSCCKATHPSGNNCMTSISEGGVANEGASCCKENQNEKKNCNCVESNPSGKHFQVHNTEEDVKDDGKSFLKLDYCKQENLSSEVITELDQDILMRDAYNKCQRLLMELGIDPVLNVLKFD